MGAAMTWVIAAMSALGGAFAVLFGYSLEKTLFHMRAARMFQRLADTAQSRPVTASDWWAAWEWSFGIPVCQGRRGEAMRYRATVITPDISEAPKVGLPNTYPGTVEKVEPMLTDAEALDKIAERLGKDYGVASIRDIVRTTGREV